MKQYTKLCDDKGLSPMQFLTEALKLRHGAPIPPNHIVSLLKSEDWLRAGLLLVDRHYPNGDVPQSRMP